MIRHSDLVVSLAHNFLKLSGARNSIIPYMVQFSQYIMLY